MKLRFDIAVTVTLVACALVTTVLVVHRELVAPLSSRGYAERRPIFIKDWRAQLAKGVRMGPNEAPVQLMEFADFECPFCGIFHTTTKNLRMHYPSSVSLTYVHFPLPMHRFALPAARVVECARDQGRFEAMYDQLFDGQDQFGLKPWDEYAIAATVPDMAAFDACIKKTDPIRRVEEGKALGAKLDVQGTPTVIINGWKLGRPPNPAELDRMVKAILAGKSPVGST